jgi:hypothetical protein
MSKNQSKIALSGIGSALLVAIAFVNVNAQGPGQISTNPLGAIVIKLDQVLAVLNQLSPQAGVDPVVLTTPWLAAAAGDIVRCPILNVGTTDLTDVSAQIYNSAGVNVGGFAFPDGLRPRAGTNARSGRGTRQQRRRPMRIRLYGRVGCVGSGKSRNRHVHGQRPRQRRRQIDGCQLGCQRDPTQKAHLTKARIVHVLRER